MTDQLQSFLFDEIPVRGVWVRLPHTWQTIRARRQGDAPAVRDLLGELCAAAALLTATVKLDGRLVLQIQGKGPLAMAAVECNSRLQMRATARAEEGAVGSLSGLTGEGLFVITLEPEEGERYQGVVPLDGETTATCLEHYMSQSEQLPTRLWLAADGEGAAGLLLQRLPGKEGGGVEDGWQRLQALASTLRPRELLDLSAETLLTRLFHEEKVRLFASRPVSFSCQCSRERVADMLRGMGQAEVDVVLATEDVVSVACEYCGQHYRFDSVDCAELFARTDSPPAMH